MLDWPGAIPAGAAGGLAMGLSAVPEDGELKQQQSDYDCDDLSDLSPRPRGLVVESCPAPPH